MLEKHVVRNPAFHSYETLTLFLSSMEDIPTNPNLQQGWKTLRVEMVSMGTPWLSNTQVPGVQRS